MNTPLKKAKEHDLNLSTQVVDESENDDTTPVVRYEITSYGADYVVSDFVSRLQRSDIIIPSFQRDYVWRLPEASRFVESILLGLPVPGVFLAKIGITDVDGPPISSTAWTATLDEFAEGRAQAIE